MLCDLTPTEEEKLILALCKFCEGSSECNNLTFGSFSEPPTFLGRAWMQLIDCGGVALLVSLLLAHRNHPRLRPALLRAMLGVEHNYSYRDTVSDCLCFPFSFVCYVLVGNGRGKQNEIKSLLHEKKDRWEIRI